MLMELYIIHVPTNKLDDVLFSSYILSKTP